MHLCIIRNRYTSIMLWWLYFGFCTYTFRINIWGRRLTSNKVLYIGYHKAHLLPKPFTKLKVVKTGKCLATNTAEMCLIITSKVINVHTRASQYNESTTLKVTIKAKRTHNGMLAGLCKMYTWNPQREFVNRVQVERTGGPWPTCISLWLLYYLTTNISNV